MNPSQASTASWECSWGFLGLSWSLHRKDRIYTTKGSEGAMARAPRACREPYVRNV